MSETPLKDEFEDYTESQFLELVTKIWLIDVETEEEHISLVLHFELLTEHPRGNGVIFYPDPKMEESPQGVVDFIKNCRAVNGKPGFKQP